VSRPEDSDLYFRSINGKAKRNDIPTWEEFVDHLDKMIPFINDTFLSQGKGMDGKTRSQVFEETLAPDIRRADKETLIRALTNGEPRKVIQSLVSIGGHDYYHPDLIEHSGHYVIVRQSLLCDTEVLVCTLKGETIGTAIADFCRESDDLAASTKRLRLVQKHNLNFIAERGPKETDMAPEHETMLSVAANVFRQSDVVDVDHYLALPMAVGQSLDIEVPDDAPETVPPVRGGKKQITGLIDAHAWEERLRNELGNSIAS
jgi:hypothetical protein